MGELKKKWTNTAKVQLRAIFENYKVKSLQSAKTIKDEMLQVVRDIHFAEQYQRDEIEPEFRRIFVRHYKLLYLEENGIIFIVRIFNTGNDPNKQRE
jgi:plasmid stabilization system protein ParE